MIASDTVCLSACGCRSEVEPVYCWQRFHPQERFTVVSSVDPASVPLSPNNSTVKSMSHYTALDSRGCKAEREVSGCAGLDMQASG